MPTVQTSSSPEQSRAVPPQMPGAHVSPEVQRSASSHAVPSPTGIAEQVPVVKLQTPVLHTSLIPERRRVADAPAWGPGS